MDEKKLLKEKNMSTVGDVEQKLIAQIFKYKNLLKTKKYLSISEREKDRVNLNLLYEKLETIKHKILDSKCYLHFGELQKELSSLLLKDETSTEERIFMLGYIVRCVCHPTISLHSVGKVSYLSKPKEQEEYPSEEVYNETPHKKFITKFKTRDVSSEEIEKIKIEVTKIISNTAINNISKKVNWQQAEIISQLAANGEICLKMKDKKIDNAPVSIVIKK